FFSKHTRTTHIYTLSLHDALPIYEGQYTSAGLSLQGGATLTAHGGALHRTQNMGGTRLLIDADGVADVPVEGNGAAVYTNMFGKDRKSTRLNSSHVSISYAVFCLK